MAVFADGRQVDDEQRQAEIPPANVVGRTLARTCDCCGSPFPCGACACLGICFFSALLLSGWGITTYDIAGDVAPNIDGFIPRRTEIGNRINTASILFDQGADGYDGQLDKQCKLYGTCLSHRPKRSAAPPPPAVPVTPPPPPPPPPAGAGSLPETCSTAVLQSAFCPALATMPAMCSQTVSNGAAMAASAVPGMIDDATMACIQRLTAGKHPQVAPSSTLSQFCPTECGGISPGMGPEPEPGACVDDPNGLIASTGLTCESMLAYIPSWMPDPCDLDLHDTVGPLDPRFSAAVPEGTTAAVVCPVSCGDCPSAGGDGYGMEPVPEPAPPPPKGGNGRRALQAQTSTVRDMSGNEYCADDSGFCYTIIYGRKDSGSVYTAESFKAVCALEEKFLAYGLAHSDDKDGQPFCQENPSGAPGCCLPPSVPRLVADEAGTTCDQLTDDQVKDALSAIAGGPRGTDTFRYMMREGPFHSGRATAEAFGAAPPGSHPGDLSQLLHDTTSPAATTWFRSRVCVHRPQDHHGNDDRRKDFLTAMWMDVGQPAWDDSDQPIRAMVRDHIHNDVNILFVYQDLYWALFSFGLIFIYITVVTNSVYIATLGMTHIFLSFFCTYAIYKTLLGWMADVEWFPFLLWLGLFVICGIGADDIFVFVDAWRQSEVLLPKATPLANRISWVHHRASMAMLITSFTTACAFFSNTVNYVIPVGLFGAFMALLVVINYIMVCTMFPAAVVIYHFFLEQRTWSNMLRWPKQGPGDGNFFPLTIFTPASLSEVMELDDNPFTGLAGAEMRPLERFFEAVFAPALYATAKPVAIGFSVFTVVVAFTFSFQMEKETTAVNLWPPFYSMEIYGQAEGAGWPRHFDTSWGCEPGCEDVYFMFGAKPNDDGNILNFNDRGQLLFDEGFTLTQEAVTWVEGLIAGLRTLSMFTARGEENQNASPFASFSHTPQPRIPVSVLEMASYPETPDFGGGCADAGADWAQCFDSYILNAPARVNATMQMLGQADAGENLAGALNGLFNTFVTYDEAGKLKSFSFALHSTLDGTDGGVHGIWDYPTRTAQWEEIEGLFNEHLKTAPAGWDSGFFFSFGFIGKDLQDSMQFSAIESASIAIVLSFITLLVFTDDLLMSALASLAILVTLVLVVGWLVAIGWRLGVLESMCMAISVGICVDFICHHAHAYNHCGEHSRKERVTHSLVEMGISVVSAAVTTFTAAVILLLFTTVTFFNKFGVFLAVCMVCSIVVALIYFHALLAIAGPLGRGGLGAKIKVAIARMRGRQPGSPDQMTFQRS